MVSRHSSSLTASVGRRATRPAAFTRMSTCPKLSKTRSRSTSTERRSLTSVTTARLWRPARSMCSQASWTSASRRPVATTSAPASARPSAIARPRPEVPPMTTATRPLRSSDLSIEPLTVHRHVGEFKTFHVLNDIGLGGRLHGAALEPDVANFRVGKAADVERAFHLPAGHVADVDIAHHGMLGAIAAFFVVEVDLQHGMRDLADFQIPKVHVLNGAAAHGIGLEAQRLVEVRAIQVTVLRKHVADAARHFTADGERAMAVFHGAVADDDVFTGHRHAPAIPVAAGFDRDAIVARIEDGILDQNVAAGIWVAAVVIRAVARDLHVPHRHVGA